MKWENPYPWEFKWILFPHLSIRIPCKDALENITTSLLISGMQMLEHLEFSWCLVGLLNWPTIIQSSPDPSHALIGVTMEKFLSIEVHALLNLLPQPQQNDLQQRNRLLQWRPQRQQRLHHHQRTALIHVTMTFTNVLPGVVTALVNQLVLEYILTVSKTVQLTETFCGEILSWDCFAPINIPN